MSKARLTKIGLKNFKSFGPEYQEIELSPLTVLLGRNNSGKSTIIQALLLLKQTLAHPRPEVQLHLEGNVDALSLRELTHGWPEGDVTENGPEITLEWTSSVMDQITFSDRILLDLIERDLGQFLTSSEARLTTTMTLAYVEIGSRIRLQSIRLRSRGKEANSSLQIRWDDGTKAYQVFRSNETGPVTSVSLALDHFVPYLSTTRDGLVESVNLERVFRIIYGCPLEDLTWGVLRKMTYVGSARMIPPSIYRPSNTPPDDVGVSGEYAAQLLHARKSDLVRFLPILKLPTDEAPLELPHEVFALPLVEAVNRSFEDLGVKNKFTVEDIKDVGFRLLFGKASIQHVGRGIGYMLPIVTAGLAADPSPAAPSPFDVTLQGYLDLCDRTAHLAMEEPESHLHPKVQTLFAHFLVSLARSARQTLVETHSDHLVRRLRGMIARTAPGSESERWLRENVNIVEVEQDEAGVTTVKQSKLTPAGAIAEHWPADFMDEASNEEQNIYFARMDKEAATAEEYGQGTEFVEENDKEG